jgi:hypothetical protein
VSQGKPSVPQGKSPVSQGKSFVSQGKVLVKEVYGLRDRLRDPVGYRVYVAG